MKPKITLKRLNEIAKEVLAEADLTYASEEEVKELMRNQIKGQERSLIFSVLGLDYDSWQRAYRIRYDGSFSHALKYLSQDYLLLKAKEIMTEVLETNEVIFTKKETEQLRKIYKERYLETLEAEFRVLAERDASLDAETLYNKYVQEGEVE